MLFWVYIHTEQAWKICLATVGFEPTTYGILAHGILEYFALFERTFKVIYELFRILLGFQNILTKNSVQSAILVL